MSNAINYPAYQDFVPFLQAVGRGQRSGRSLTQAEACEAMTLLLKNKITPEQRGAFLMLLRVREETAAEVAGFTQACRATLPSELRHKSDVTIDLDIGAYAGKRRQHPWFLLAVACLVEQGVKVGMHGTHEPASERLYIKSVLSQISAMVNKDKAPKQTNHWQAMDLSDIPTLIAQYGFVYADLTLLHPPLDALIQLRELFGLRSCANTLARLLNPYMAEYSIQGVHHQHVDDKHIDVAALLDEKNVLCFRGEGGEPEVDPCKETDLKFYRSGSKQTILLTPEQRWEIKPKALDVSTLLLVWKGAKLHDYGENTVMLTLTALLMLLNGHTKRDAGAEAINLWHSRDSKRFMGIELN